MKKIDKQGWAKVYDDDAYTASVSTVEVPFAGTEEDYKKAAPKILKAIGIPRRTKPTIKKTGSKPGSYYYYIDYSYTKGSNVITTRIMWGEGGRYISVIVRVRDVNAPEPNQPKKKWKGAPFFGAPMSIGMSSYYYED